MELVCKSCGRPVDMVDNKMTAKGLIEIYECINCNLRGSLIKNHKSGDAY